MTIQNSSHANSFANRASRPRVLSIAGVDPSGGAGILADVKSFTAFGAYSMAVVAALTAQNTTGVSEVKQVEPKFLREQLEMISDDIVVDSVKIGLLGNSDAIEEVKGWIEKIKPKWVVLDPVMVATSGDRLLEKTAEIKLKELAKFATVITPNLPELAVFAQEDEAKTVEIALEQARKLQKELGVIVLLKTGHLASVSERLVLTNAQTKPSARDIQTDAQTKPSDTAQTAHSLSARALQPTATLQPTAREAQKMSDYAVTENGVFEIEGEFVETKNTHGTGCSLSSAIAAILPQIEDVVETCKIAKSWLTSSLKQSQFLQIGGEGKSRARFSAAKNSHGPIDHLNQLIPPKFSNYAQILTQDIENRISKMPFIVDLASGKLDKSVFANYLQQDNIYLETYVQILLAASQKSPNQRIATFFRNCAEFDVQAEVEFHNQWLSENGFSVEKQSSSRATQKYVDLLSAAIQSDFPVLLSALQPCFWVYSQIGKELLLQSKKQGNDFENNPFGSWIKTYSDPIFSSLADELNLIVDDAAKSVNADTWKTMLQTYRAAAVLEFDFFNQRP